MPVCKFGSGRASDPGGGDPRIFGSHLRRSRPFPAAQNPSLGLRYLLLTHGWLKCHTADTTASRGAAPVTIPSYAQWVPSLPPAPVTDQLWPAAATQSDSGLSQGNSPTARRQAEDAVSCHQQSWRGLCSNMGRLI